MFAWIAENTAWMYWTLPSAIAFITLFNVLIGMTVWEVLSPTMARKGFFPIETTRGDRLFIGIMSMIIIFLLWLAFVGDTIADGYAHLRLSRSHALSTSSGQVCVGTQPERFASRMPMPMPGVLIPPPESPCPRELSPLCLRIQFSCSIGISPTHKRCFESEHKFLFDFHDHFR
ncbi:MAG: hypothetical protein B6245_10305 [Desulfobacteraceae bacterium 4572_88]|nr:MAG: hypothetical protein B6245_10305 [Desulfobacteraceae bacterium 4572_88]